MILWVGSSFDEPTFFVYLALHILETANNFVTLHSIRYNIL